MGPSSWQSNSAFKVVEEEDTTDAGSSTSDAESICSESTLSDSFSCLPLQCPNASLALRRPLASRSMQRLTLGKANRMVKKSFEPMETIPGTPADVCDKPPVADSLCPPPGLTLPTATESVSSNSDRDAEEASLPAATPNSVSLLPTTFNLPISPKSKAFKAAVPGAPSSTPVHTLHGNICSTAPVDLLSPKRSARRGLLASAKQQRRQDIATLLPQTPKRSAAFMAALAGNISAKPVLDACGNIFSTRPKSPKGAQEVRKSLEMLTEVPVKVQLPVHLVRKGKELGPVPAKKMPSFVEYASVTAAALRRMDPSQPVNVKVSDFFIKDLEHFVPVQHMMAR